MHLLLVDALLSPGFPRIKQSSLVEPSFAGAGCTLNRSHDHLFRLLPVPSVPDRTNSHAGLCYAGV
jgi:hypothetical protein